VKLAGVKVVDLSLFLPGPHLTMMMADHGAEVIKIEPYESGEPTRGIGMRVGAHTAYFRNTNRGKKSVRLNLKHPEGREILLRLAETADVLLEGFRPGVAERLGVDYRSVSERAPQIVYCSLSAFGQTGAYRDKPAHDLAVQAMAGLASLNVDSHGKPTMPGVQAADMAGSLVALAGILMALIEQRRTGKGDYLDISMHDALLGWTPHASATLLGEGRAPVPRRERFWGGNAFYNLYETKDGAWLALGGAEHRFAENFLAKAGRSDLASHAREPAGAQAPLEAYLRDLFKQKTLGEWLAWLADVDCCYAPLRTLQEAIDDPNTRARAMTLLDEAGAGHLGVPIKFERAPAQPNLRAPRFGEHSAEILRSLGYSDADVERLRADRVI
jgi:crotonobetainyl-CoA:carnitine CoA-transferase CaiB-like acyl-CoA transferase